MSSFGGSPSDDLSLGGREACFRSAGNRGVNDRGRRAEQNMRRSPTVRSLVALRCHTGLCPVPSLRSEGRLRAPGRPGARGSFWETRRTAESGRLRGGAGQRFGVALDFVPGPVHKDGRAPSGTWKTGGWDEFRETGAEGRSEVPGRLDLPEGPYLLNARPSGRLGERGRVEERSSGVQPGRVRRSAPSGAGRSAWQRLVEEDLRVGSRQARVKAKEGKALRGCLLTGTGIPGGTPGAFVGWKKPTRVPEGANP
jgi:hypothetical protein